MSREILFRGKRIDNSEWVQGYYCKRKTGHYTDEGLHEEYRDCIIKEFSDGGIIFCDVDSSTVCRYTGLNDEHGNKIFEEDICTVAGEDGYFVVEWDKDEARFILFGEDLVVNFSNFYGNECEIVGNIFDNPELTKGGESK